MLKEFLQRKSKLELQNLSQTFGLSPYMNKPELLQSLLVFIKDPKNKILVSSHVSSSILEFESDSSKLEIFNNTLNSYVFPSSKPCRKCGHQLYYELLQGPHLFQSNLCPICVFDNQNPFDKLIKVLVLPWIPTTKLNSDTTILAEIKTITLDIQTKTLLNDPHFQIQIRCCRLKSSSFQTEWPKQGALVINNKIAFKFSPNNQNSNERPINITRLLNPDTANEIFTFSKQTQHFYFFTVALVKLDRIECCKKIKENFYLNKEESIKFIKKFFTLDEQDSSDDELMICSEKVRLTCPLSLRVIKNPVRGKFCSHLGCFDLEPFVNRNKVIGTDVGGCPICGKEIFYLVYDLYFEEIINEAKALGVFRVEIFDSGKYSFENVAELPRVVLRDEDPGPCKREPVPPY